MSFHWELTLYHSLTAPKSSVTSGKSCWSLSELDPLVGYCVDIPQCRGHKDRAPSPRGRHASLGSALCNV